MALSVLETEPGRAMLLNIAIEQADLGRLFGHGEFLRAMQEPWPHWVHYRACHGRTNYCPPDTFGFLGNYGPTDCDWMVPGTWRR